MVQMSQSICSSIAKILEIRATHHDTKLFGETIKLYNKIWNDTIANSHDTTCVCIVIEHYLMKHMRKFIKHIRYDNLEDFYENTGYTYIVSKYIFAKLDKYIIKFKTPVIMNFCYEKIRRHKCDAIFVALVKHMDVVGDSDKKRLCIVEHYADVPDMQIDVVCVPIVRLVNINNEWMKYDDATKCGFDILNDNITTPNVHTKTHDFVDVVRQHMPPKIQFPQSDNDTFA